MRRIWSKIKRKHRGGTEGAVCAGFVRLESFFELLKTYCIVNGAQTTEQVVSADECDKVRGSEREGGLSLRICGPVMDRPDPVTRTLPGLSDITCILLMSNFSSLDP